MLERRTVAPGVDLRGENGNWVARLNPGLITRKAESHVITCPLPNNMVDWRLPTHAGNLRSAARFVADHWQNKDGTPITLNL